jgi:hypothetical protein
MSILCFFWPLGYRGGDADFGWCLGFRSMGGYDGEVIVMRGTYHLSV